MRTLVIRVFAVIGAAAVLVMGFDYVTYAATGQSLLLGKANSANRTTTVTNTGAGAALALITKSTAYPPFTTNAKGKVVNLNADRVDGLTATQILTASHTTNATVFTDTASSHAGNVDYAIGKLPRGSYLVTLNAALSLNTAGNLAATPPTMNYMRCWLHGNGNFFEIGEATADSFDFSAFVTPSFATYAALTGTESLVLSCYTKAADGWSSSGDKSVTLTFVRLDGATARSIS